MSDSQGSVELSSTTGKESQAKESKERDALAGVRSGKAAKQHKYLDGCARRRNQKRRQTRLAVSRKLAQQGKRYEPMPDVETEEETLLRTEYGFVEE